MPQERPPYLWALVTAVVVFADLSRHPGADDGLLGHLRVHRRRQGARAFPTRPAIRSSSSWPTPSVCCRWPARTPCGSISSPRSPAPPPRRSGSWWPSGGFGASCPIGGPATARRSAACWSGPPRGRCGTSHGEREGVHRLAALHRRGDVAGGALGRRRAGHPPRPLAGAHRLRAGADLHQPPDGRARASGAGGLRAVDRLAHGAPALGHRDVLRPAAGGERRVDRHAPRRRRAVRLLIAAQPAGPRVRAWKSPRDPLVYLGLLAVVVGISLNYLWLPMRAGAVSRRSTRASRSAS